MFDTFLQQLIKLKPEVGIIETTVLHESKRLPLVVMPVPNDARVRVYHSDSFKKDRLPHRCHGTHNFSSVIGLVHVPKQWSANWFDGRWEIIAYGNRCESSCPAFSILQGRTVAVTVELCGKPWERDIAFFDELEVM